MFPFQSDEFPFEVSNLDNTTNITIDAHLINQPNNEDPALNLNPKSLKSRKKRPQKSAHDNANNVGQITASDFIATKKITHRVVERKRRQEMSTLYASLSSLLPMEYSRGKRSLCDLVEEATNYIKNLEMNVKELRENVDKLKQSLSSIEKQQIINGDNNIGCSSSSTTTTTSKISSSSSSTGHYNVSIHKFSRALQFEISVIVGEEDEYPLSKILNVLAEEGLDVVSCVSNIVNQKWIYVIYCEVDDTKLYDSCYLQEKFMSILSRSDS